MRDGALKIEKMVADNGIETLRLSGPLTLSTLFELQESLKFEPKPKTVIDLSGVPFIDSAGLGCLLSFHASCKRSGRNYVLAGMAQRVYTILTTSKVDRLIHHVANAQQAVAFLSQ